MQLKEKVNETIESLIQYKYWKEFLKGVAAIAVLLGLNVIIQEVIKYFFGMQGLMKATEVSIYIIFGYALCLYTQALIDKRQQKERFIREELKSREEALR